MVPKNEGEKALFFVLYLNILVYAPLYFIRYFGIPFYIIIIVAVIINIITVIVVYNDAKKNFTATDPSIWSIIIFFTGIIGLAIYIFEGRKYQKPHEKLQSQKKQKRDFTICPFCEENVEPDWNICRNCKKILPR